MRTATTYIAESMVKAVGVAGIEAMAMKNTIYSIWEPLAEMLYTEIEDNCFDYANNEIRVEYADAIFTAYRLKMSDDFIEKVLPYIEEYAGYAWDRGREDALGGVLSGLLTIQKDQESIITDLVTLTGSTRANVQRTIKRWFRTTQGQYFERFIVPETARLLSYEEGVSLRSIGTRYKEFVKGEGYWSGISEFNTETSKVFAQVQSLHEMNVTSYTIVAIIDEKTCDVCQYLNGTTWSVEQAVTKMYDLLISEADAAADINPFPPRSTPKDFEDPQETPYNLPPYHPRCRCSVRSTTKVTALPQQVLASPFEAGPRPSDKLLNKVFAQYVTRSSATSLRGVEGIRALTPAEWKVAKEAWESMPFEVKKWASRNTDNFNMYIRTGDDVTSRVIGSNIEMNAKFFDPDKYGPQPLQHELRHALVNRSAINARGGGDTIWRELSEAAADPKKGFRPPTHVNAMYQINGNRGLQAANAASDEFLAMIGDHYRPDMSMDELIKSVMHKEYGIDVSDKIGSTLISSNSRWTAREAKHAVEYWWSAMDIDNNTILSKKQLLAKQSYKPFTKSMRTTGVSNEVAIRDLFRSAGIKDAHQTGDNAPFDVWIGANPDKYYSRASRKKPDHLIEVKTLINNTNDKITMRKAALDRKKAEYKKLKKKGTTMHTVVFDERTGKIYYRKGVGSFRLSTMQEVDEAKLQEMFGGKATVTRVVELPDTTERLSAIRGVSPKVKTRAVSNVKTKEVLGGDTANEVRIVTVGTGKKKYIFKPVEGETYWSKLDSDLEYIRLVEKEFGVSLRSFDDLTSEHWIWLDDEYGVSPHELMLRGTITNHEVTLTQREAFALDVANRLGLDNEYAIVPQFMIAEDERGNIAGLLMEYIDSAEVEAKFLGRKMTPEEVLQMSAFDYLIGNLDRHDSNWLRKIHKGRVTATTRTTGTPVYIDHGYCMPGQEMDLGGLSELRLMEATQAYAGMEYDVDPEFVMGLADKIQKFLDEDAIKLADNYGFDMAEVEAMLSRGQSLTERLRMANFSSLLVKHNEDYGIWGVDDSFIE